MINPLLEIQPHVVSRNLRGYSFFIYGLPKCGKTTIATSFPKTLLFPFEKGYGALANVMPYPVNNWQEFKKALKFLESPEVQEKFHNVAMDVVDIAWQYCCDYILKTNSTEERPLQTMDDLPFGKAYALASKEFDVAIRRILQLGYGLIMLSHAEEKLIKDKNKKDDPGYTRCEPTIDKRARLICTRTCDVVAYARSTVKEDGTWDSRLFLRESVHYSAGSRFAHMPKYVEFSYDVLEKAVLDAIDAVGGESAAPMINEAMENRYRGENFLVLMEDFQTAVRSLMAKDKEKYKPKVEEVIKELLGDGKKVSDCTAEDDKKIIEITNRLNVLLEEDLAA